MGSKVIHTHELPVELQASLNESLRLRNAAISAVVRAKAAVYDAERALSDAEIRFNCEARLACRSIDVDPDQGWTVSADGKFISREE